MTKEQLPNDVVPFDMTINGVRYKGFYRRDWDMGFGWKARVISYSYSKAHFPLNEWQLATEIDNELAQAVI